MCENIFVNQLQAAGHLGSGHKEAFRFLDTPELLRQFQHEE